MYDQYLTLKILTEINEILIIKKFSLQFLFNFELTFIKRFYDYVKF